MDPFNALSTTATVRKIPPLKEAPPAKVMSRASTDLEKDLDATKEVTGGAGVPSVKMADWSASHGLWPIPPPPVMRASHHQRTKVPLVAEAVEHA
jgi:hypothetical protein